MDRAGSGTPAVWTQVPPPQDTAFALLFFCKMLTIFPRSARNCEPQFLGFESFRIAKIQRGNYSSRYTLTSSWKEDRPGEASSCDLLVPAFSIVDWCPSSTQHPSPSCAHRRFHIQLHTETFASHHPKWIYSQTENHGNRFLKTYQAPSKTGKRFFRD